MAPLLLDLAVGNLVEAVDDSLDESESQVGVTHVPFDALLEHIVAKLSVHNLVQIAAVDELLDDLALQLIVSLLDSVLNEVRRVLVHGKPREVAQESVVDGRAQIVRIVLEHVQQDVVGELVLSVGEHILLDLC